MAEQSVSNSLSSNKKSVARAVEIGLVHIPDQPVTSVKKPVKIFFFTIKNLRTNLFNFFGQQAHFFKIINVGNENASTRLN